MTNYFAMPLLIRAELGASDCSAIEVFDGVYGVRAYFSRGLFCRATERWESMPADARRRVLLAGRKESAKRAGME